MTQITRREFVGCAAGSLMMTLTRGSRTWLGGEVRILDLEDQCAFRESLAGFQAALANSPRPQHDVLVVPSALGISPPAVGLIEDQLWRGATVILESGAGFTCDGDVRFCRHRDALRTLGLEIGSPMQLWPGRHTPYIELTWPTTAMVRDFSCAVPVASATARVIARVNQRPVALVRERLVFLGSPIGPALWVGDTEARRWLFEVVRAA